ncbi:MAG: sugar ABC transporter permease YjfF, partial [Butyrivibrio sp.]|nr:sugar ABC transporter permease YjfF [Butyrivibrio sp.]
CVMLTGGIDISVGSLIAMDCMILAYGMGVKGWPCIPLIILILVIGLVFGAVQGYLIGYLKIQPFIITMAGMFFARGMTAVICTDQISITEQMNHTFYAWANAKITLPAIFGYVNKKGKTVIPFIRPTVVIALLVVVVIFLVLKYTKFGRSLYAVGGNQQSATMMGLNVRATKMKAYMLSSFLCSIGGICYCLNTMSGSVQQALGFEMNAIASSVIGGTLLTGGVGNVIGSLFGVLINGTISTLVTTNGKLLSSWSNIMTAILLCFFIILQSVFAYIKDRNSR